MIRIVNNFLEKVSVNFEYVDFGGGMGIDYSSNKKTFDFKKLAFEIHKFSKRNECKKNVPSFFKTSISFFKTFIPFQKTFISLKVTRLNKTKDTPRSD